MNGWSDFSRPPASCRRPANPPPWRSCAVCWRSCRCMQRLFDAVLDILCRAGFLVLRDERLEATEALLDAGLAARIERPDLAEAALQAQAPWLNPFLAVTQRCLSAYAEALAGRVAPTELLFPGGSGALSGAALP